MIVTNHKCLTLFQAALMIDFTSMKNIMEILYDSLSFKVGKPRKEKPKNHDLPFQPILLTRPNC